MSFELKTIYTGLPRILGRRNADSPMERKWESAIYKEPVHGPVWLSKTNLAGDAQADTKHHGGPEKAVFAYAFEHYAYWETFLGRTDILPGAMGENFLTQKGSEEWISIGDTFLIGDSLIQVSQPRQPCWKPARRFQIKSFPLYIQNSGRTGWYFRVIKEGFVEAGQHFTLLDRPYPQWTIQRCNEIMHHELENTEQAQALAECSLLAENWKITLTKRVERGEYPDSNKRLIGPN